MTKTTAVVKISALLLMATPAFATGTPDPEPEPDPSNSQSQTQGQHQGQAQGQGQEQAATATLDATVQSDSASSAVNEGIDVSDNSITENNSTNTVLVPNNNTESCLRVFGIAWGKNGESGALGLPWRSKKCDFEQAADDAFAGGERELGWFWKCQNANLYGSFKPKGVSDDDAKISCHVTMVGHKTAQTTITTMTETIETLMEEHSTQRRLARESRLRLESACEESKDRILEACMTK